MNLWDKIKNINNKYVKWKNKFNKVIGIKKIMIIIIWLVIKIM